MILISGTKREQRSRASAKATQVKKLRARLRHFSTARKNFLTYLVKRACAKSIVRNRRGVK